VRSFALLLMLFAADAQARDRFHILTEQLTKRLGRGKGGAKRVRNFEAVGNYKQATGDIVGGTAFIVSVPAADGTALVLTNHHVALYQKKTVRGDQVLFQPGGATDKPVVAEVVKKVYANKALDYALLRVRLPESLRGLEPVQLDRRRTAKVEGLYNPSFPRIWAQEQAAKPNERFVSGSPKRALYLEAKRGQTMPKMLQVGRSEGVEYQNLEMLKLPNQVGSSGSPVFSQRTHRAVGMLTAGSGTNAGMMRPMRLILQHLADKQSQLTQADRQMLAPLLR